MALHKVTWRGGTFSSEFAHALIEANRLLPTIPVVVVQGGFNGTNVSASAGTHAGDAVDISVRGMSTAQIKEVVRVLRLVGIAAWWRHTYQGFSGDHIHGIPNGWGYPSPSAARQATSYRNGHNGLASNGRDDGPRQYTHRTWADYLKAASRQVDSNGHTYVPKNSPAAKKRTGIYALGRGRPISYSATLGHSMQNRKYLQQILAAQKQPNGKPYYGGPIDGIFGPVWDAGLTAWRKAVYKTSDPSVVSGKLGRASFTRLVEWAGFKAVK